MGRLILIAGLILTGWSASGENWNQFRGPNGQGLAQTARIPVQFGPEENVSWKTAVPPGHSSPVIWNNRVFLTAADPAHKDRLLTLGLDGRTGKTRWQQSLASQTRVEFHALNNAAASTPVVDSRHVYVYFGTYGLVCYDHSGREIWKRPIETPASKYGMATSPILHQGKVILVLDGDKGTSRILAVRTDTGATVWEQPRPLFRANWSTPMIFRHGRTEEIVVLGAKRLTTYDPANGQELWWAGGFSQETVCVPATGEGLLFAGAAALGGRGDDTLDAEGMWRNTLQEFDRNHDGKIQREEMTEGFGFVQRPELPKDNPGYAMPMGSMDSVLRMFDRDKDGVISEPEWLGAMSGFASFSHPTLAAFRPGATDDARKTHLAWEVQRGIPEVPSPLYCRGKIYLMRDGGLLTALEAATGKELYRDRIGAPGQYIASPIAAGDKLVVAATSGVVSVIQLGEPFKVLAQNDFKAAIFATPAVAGNRLYVRTDGHLYAIGK